MERRYGVVAWARELQNPAAMGEARRFGPGDRIGDYRIDALVESGPQGEVLAATHVVLPRTATIRVAAPGPAGIRLMREACMVEALRHAGVPRVFDCGRLADRTPWVATERIPGPTLAEMIGAGPLTLAMVATIVRDVAEILAHTHARGVVHRAVRPASIVMVDDPRGRSVCVTAWSDARTLDAAPEPCAAGPHDAPELAGDGAHDPSADVYALGVVAYEALSGTQLFDGAAPLTVVADPVARYFARRGPVSTATEQFAWLIDDMLARDPGSRPTSVEVGRVAARAAVDIERELAEGAALAVALLEVEEIALTTDDADDTDDSVTIEIVALSDRPTARIAPPELPPGAAVARIRKPRWTPLFGRFSSDQADQVSGEIDPEARFEGDSSKD